jgi:hypothetical protein
MIYSGLWFDIPIVLAFASVCIALRKWAKA